jgi:hypothetical protein
VSPAAGLQIRERPGGIVFRVRVQPKASRDEFVAVRDGVLWVRVTEPPVGGQANRACMSLLSKSLGIPASSLLITGGARARIKDVQASGVSSPDLIAAVGRALGGS